MRPRVLSQSVRLGVIGCSLEPKVGQDLDELRDRRATCLQAGQESLPFLDVVRVGVRHEHDRGAVECHGEHRRRASGHDRRTGLQSIG